MAHTRDTDKRLLEVGSGTGQHAVYMGQHLPGLAWQTSDVRENHVGIQMWLDEHRLQNVLPPLPYQIGQDPWPDFKADLIFTANTLHIISAELVDQLIVDMGSHLAIGNRVMIYGPFKYQGEYTSESNADFNLWLQERDPLSGIRDFESVHHAMDLQSMKLIADHNMPANNQMLIYEKS